MNTFFKLLISVLIPLVVGGISGFFTSQSVSGWYATIQKPWFNPPNWIFGPVWTLLYVLMGISFFVVWKTEVAINLKNKAMLLFTAQLLVNFLWSYFFFYCQEPGWALVDIILMWGLILLTILSFGKISSLSAWLLVPYICWVSFAAVLNYSIWSLNR
jgi:tryptophan-rich sensory protein